MSKKIRRIVSVAAPVVASFIPGIGPLGAAAIGAGSGFLSGGGLKSALLGGATAGAGNYLAGGGLAKLGLTGPGSIFGTAAQSGPQLPWQTPTGLPWGGGAQLPWQQASQGSGIIGSVTKGLSDVGINLGGGGSSYGGGSSGPGLSSLSSVLSGINSTNANEDAEDDLLAAQRQALSRYQPYVDAKFNPGDLTQDPGYQFRLQEGQRAIDRSLGARGKIFSGQALKASQDYGQGLADSTYNDAYNRWLKQNQQNIGVAGNLADLDTQGGNVRATAGIGRSNILSRTLSDLLSGYGAYSPYSYAY